MKNIIYNHECFCEKKVTYFSLKAFFLKHFCYQDNLSLEYKMYRIVKMSWKEILKSFIAYKKRYQGKYKSPLDFWDIANHLKKYETKPRTKGISDE